jgi:hypothetical protein
MMIQKAPTYTLQFTGGDASLELEKRVSSIQVLSELGKSSCLKLLLAISPSKLKSLALNQVPKQVFLAWNGTPFFQGETTQIQILSQSLIEITFQDFIHRLDRLYTETETKKQKLQHFIQNLLKPLKDSPELRFRTPSLFDEELPTFSLGYRTVREVLDELAKFYGFTYCTRAQEKIAQMVFLRAGTSLNTQPIPISMKKNGVQPIHHHRARWKYDTVTVSLADNSGDHLKKPLKNQCMREPLSLFQPNQDIKKSFEFTLPEIELLVPHRDIYARAERILPYQYTQKIQSTDSLKFSLFEPKVQVGDSIQLQECFSGYQEKSTYLIQSTRLEIRGSQPKLQVIAMCP